MDVVTFSLWTVAIIAVVGSALAIRLARKPPIDPEENLKLLLGPRGMAVRDYNRAAAESNHNARMLEAVTKAADARRAEGNLQEAEKLDAYARTVRARDTRLEP